MAKRYTFISDLHLGDQSNADNFHVSALTPLLDALVASIHADAENHLILLGDVFELWKFSMDDIFEHYAPQMDAILSLALENRLTWILGNHDYMPLHRYLDAGRLFGTIPLSTSFSIPALALYATHGHDYDPNMEVLIPVPGKELAFQISRESVYYLKYVERFFPHVDDKLGVFLGAVQKKMGNFRSFVENLMDLNEDHREAVLGAVSQTAASYVPPSQATESPEDDPFEKAAFELMAEHGYKTVLMGHTHHPRVVERAGLTYINMGSWCFGSKYPATYVVADVEQGTVSLECTKELDGEICRRPYDPNTEAPRS